MKKLLAAALLCVLVLASPVYAKAAGGLCYAGGCNLGECFMDTDYDGLCGNHYFYDANGDGVCDYHFYWDANNDGICDLFIDANGDGICDHCHDHGRPVQTAAVAVPQQGVAVSPQPNTVVYTPQSTTAYTYNYGGYCHNGGYRTRVGGHHGGHH